MSNMTPYLLLGYFQTEHYLVVELPSGKQKVVFKNLKNCACTYASQPIVVLNPLKIIHGTIKTSNFNSYKLTLYISGNILFCRFCYAGSDLLNLSMAGLKITKGQIWSHV